MSNGVALLRVNKARKKDGITNEEDGSVVSDEIPVAFFGVEFDSEAARVACRVGRTTFTADGGEADGHRRPLPDLRKDGSFAVFRNVVSNFKVTKGT